MQLEGIVKDQLPAKFVQWQTTLPDGKRPDCLLDFPQPVGKIMIDSKIPIRCVSSNIDKAQALERNAHRCTQKTLETELKTDVKGDLDEKYIDGNMVEKALLFVPSEGIFALIHEQCNDLARVCLQKRRFHCIPRNFMGGAQYHQGCFGAMWK